MCRSACLVPTEVRRGCWIPGSGVTDSCELPCRCWGTNPVICKSSKCSSSPSHPLQSHATGSGAHLGSCSESKTTKTRPPVLPSLMPRDSSSDIETPGNPETPHNSRRMWALSSDKRGTIGSDLMATGTKK